jgi:hypothetical protein
LDASEPASRAVWESLGRPLIPSLLVDERPVPVWHISQVARMLDLPLPDTSVNASLAWDTVTVLSSWLDHTDRMGWELLNAPTPSRGRSIRNLTVNVFHPFELLPLAWTERRFHWDPDADAAREAALGSKDELQTWARDVLATWQVALLEHGPRMEVEDHPVDTPRGEVAYSVVLTFQRYHAAAHHRQLIHFLRAEGYDVSAALDVEQLPDIGLAQQVF